MMWLLWIYIDTKQNFIYFPDNVEFKMYTLKRLLVINNFTNYEK